MTERQERSGYLPLPETGRVFRARRTVRLGDVTPSGRLRLDAVARYLQDVAEDDATDADWPRSIGWLLRRSAISIDRFPERNESLELATFCSATAPRWAERTTTITGELGGSLQASAVWVAVDVATGRPTRLGEQFERDFAPSAGGRRATVRLELPDPGAAALASAAKWPLRATDLDVWDHVNNAICWAAAEDALARSGADWLPRRAVIEHDEAIVASDRPRLATEARAAGLDLWLVADDRVLASGRLAR